MDKPTLLMIHGLVGTLDYFDPARRIDSAGVHAIDLLGYGGLREWPVGGEADAPRGLTLQSQVDHVASWIVLTHPVVSPDMTARAIATQGARPTTTASPCCSRACASVSPTPAISGSV